MIIHTQQYTNINTKLTVNQQTNQFAVTRLRSLLKRNVYLTKTIDTRQMTVTLKNKSYLSNHCSTKSQNYQINLHVN